MAVPILNLQIAALRRRVAAATIIGIDATMGAAVDHAKARHRTYPPASAPYTRYANRTRDTTSLTKVVRTAVDYGAGRIAGEWGSLSNHALYLEIGTSTPFSGEPRAQVRAAEGGGFMWAIPGPSVPPLMANRMFLRPAASASYPLLAAKIAVAFNA